MATILAVDDRAVDREFLATLLGYVGYDVLQAGNGEQALESVRHRRPDLVITSVLMPVMDGAELADRVHDDPDIAHIPILFYNSSYCVTEARVLAKSCRAAGVLPKAADPQEILDAVAAALGTMSTVAALPDAALTRSTLPSAKVPDYMRELSGLQGRLRRTVHQSVEQAESQRVAATEADAIASSFHSLSLRLATLLELDVSLSSERDAHAMLELFCRAAQDILDCRYVAVGILDGAGKRFAHVVSRGLDGDARWELANVDPAAGLLGSVVASGKPVSVDADNNSDATLGLPSFHPPVASLIVVPIPTRSAIPVGGWIYFAEKIDGDRFATEDEQFAVTLSAQLALAYGNLALYEDACEHATKLEAEVLERRRAQAELAYRASHDQTTGLPRFASIEMHLHEAFIEAIAHDRRVMLAYVDLDRFHAINDTRGRAVGDEVLRTIAARLLANCGRNGYVAHVGGDEFAVVRTDAEDMQDQVEFGESLRRAIEHTIQFGDHRLYMTCSIGVSCFPDNGASPVEMLRQAEAAMRVAKREGRNGVYAFSNEHKHALEERSTLGVRLDDAIRAGELVVHYQPQVRGSEWCVYGFEALVRWQSPEFGLLAPGRFLDVAEDLGLIVDIGDFVLRSVCRQARAWLDSGITNFSISINVSSLELQRPDFVDIVRAALAEWNVPAPRIEFELTEKVMVSNVERALATMRQLKALGVQLALDDFGTGYSSLSYLRRFPLDKLKIDQSFVGDISADGGAAGICRAIVTLGHQLGMTVLAEGVETAAQANYLYQNDCDEFQGFYFGRPVPATDAFEHLRHRHVAGARLRMP